MSGASTVKSIRPLLDVVMAAALFPATSFTTPARNVMQCRVENAKVDVALIVITRPETTTPAAATEIVSTLDEHVDPPINEKFPEPLEMFSLYVSAICEFVGTEVALFAGLVDASTGAVRSTVTLSADDTGEILPEASSCTAVTDHSPSATAANVHDAPDVLPAMVHVLFA
jgi:hypothetical protein